MRQDTILRDLKQIYLNLRLVVFPFGSDREQQAQALRNWDLWGPMVSVQRSSLHASCAISCAAGAWRLGSVAEQQQPWQLASRWHIAEHAPSRQTEADGIRSNVSQHCTYPYAGGQDGRFCLLRTCARPKHPGGYRFGTDSALVCPPCSCSPWCLRRACPSAMTRPPQYSRCAVDSSGAPARHLTFLAAPAVTVVAVQVCMVKSVARL